MWTTFFRDAGITEQPYITKYSRIFDTNHIRMDMLIDLNSGYLREMGITPMGDIIAILKHAKTVHEDKRESEYEQLLNTKSMTTTDRTPNIHPKGIIKENVNGVSTLSPEEKELPEVNLNSPAIVETVAVAKKSQIVNSPLAGLMKNTPDLEYKKKESELTPTVKLCPKAEINTSANSTQGSSLKPMPNGLSQTKAKVEIRPPSPPEVKSSPGERSPSNSKIISNRDRRSPSSSSSSSDDIEVSIRRPASVITVPPPRPRLRPRPPTPTKRQYYDVRRSYDNKDSYSSPSTYRRREPEEVITPKIIRLLPSPQRNGGFDNNIGKTQTKEKVRERERIEESPPRLRSEIISNSKNSVFSRITRRFENDKMQDPKLKVDKEISSSSNRVRRTPAEDVGSSKSPRYSHDRYEDSCSTKKSDEDHHRHKSPSSTSSRYKKDKEDRDRVNLELDPRLRSKSLSISSPESNGNGNNSSGGGNTTTANNNIYEDYGSRYACRSAKISRNYNGPKKLHPSWFL